MLVGLDIGTSATKGVITAPDGRVVATASAGYEVHRPREGWSEQPAADWWHATCIVTRRLLAHMGPSTEGIRGVGLSGQMHGAVLLSARSLANAKDGPIDALRPVLLWNDQRTDEQCRLVEQAAGSNRDLVSAVGNAALTGLTLPKVLWSRQHEPELFAQVAKVMCPKDFIRLQLTGEAATDITEASGWPLIDLKTRKWHVPLARELDLSPELLPRVLESGTVAGTISPWACRQTGLPAGTPVVAGAGDNMAGAVGAGVCAPGALLATLGTSGVVYAHTQVPHADNRSATTHGRLQCMAAADGSHGNIGQWATTGCMLSAAGSLAWARDTIAPGLSFDDLVVEAGIAPAGCDGLLFLPHLSGERCPYAMPHARGAWIGLSARHTRAHLLRAVMEGVAVTMGQMMSLARSAGVDVRQVRLGGGGAKSTLWRQMLADAFGHPVVSLISEEGPAHGAALLAGVGAGIWPTIAQAIAEAVATGEVREPNPTGTDLFKSLTVAAAKAFGSLHAHGR